MSRVAPWQKKKSAHWQLTREELRNTTLYLVNRLGPTVFSVRDDNLGTYKVVLGNPHSCSCSRIETEELCVHQMYCLIKVLRVNELHPLCYQLGVTDGEAEQILSGQCSDDRIGKSVENLSAAARARRKARLKAGQDPSSPDKSEDPGNVERQPLSDCGPEGEDLCPICQDGMNNNQALTWCRTGCGNNMHAKCMQTFAQYKISSHAQVECPLCRESWNLALLKEDVRGKATLKQSCAPVYCMSCTLPIRSGKMHRCIECSQKRTAAATLPKLSDIAVTPGATPDSTPRNRSGISWRGNAPEVLTTAAQFAEQAAAQAERTAARAVSSSGASRAADYCDRCFMNAIDKVHAFHHFISSAADAPTDDDVVWEVSDNPLQSVRNASLVYPSVRRGSGAGDDGLTPELRALQERELTMDDYSLLLELDNVPKKNVAEHIADALPKSKASKEGSDVSRVDVSVLEASAYSDVTEDQPLSPLRRRPEGPCWCKVTTQAAHGMDIAQISKSTLRDLPCGHVAHAFCVQTALEKSLSEDAISYCKFRCKHSGCKQLLFPSLNRARKKIRPKNTSGSNHDGTKSSAVTAAGGGGSRAKDKEIASSSSSSMLDLAINGGNIGNFGVANPEGFGVIVASSFGSALIAAPSAVSHGPDGLSSILTSTSNSSLARDSDVMSASRTMASTDSINFTGIEGTSVTGSVSSQRAVGGANNGKVIKGKVSKMFDARKGRPPKPNYSKNNVHHPANAERGRQSFHLSELSPHGKLSPNGNGVSGSAEYLRSSTPSSRSITPIVRTNAANGSSSARGSRSQPRSLSQSNETDSGDQAMGFGFGDLNMSIRGGTPKPEGKHNGLVKIIAHSTPNFRTRSSPALSTDHSSLNQLMSATGSAFSGSPATAAATTGNRGRLMKGAVLTSSLARGKSGHAAFGSGSSKEVGLRQPLARAPSPVQLPALAAAQIKGQSRAKLDYNLQPSGNSRSIEVDETVQLRAAQLRSLDMNSGMGWLAGADVDVDADDD